MLWSFCLPSSAVSLAQYDHCLQGSSSSLLRAKAAGLKLDSADDFILELSNGIHGFAIKKISTVSVSHTVDSVSYTIPAPGITDEISVDFGITGPYNVTGAIMSYKVKGNGVAYEKYITLGAPLSI